MLLFALGCTTPKELIPFYKNGKYGLMDENSRKRVKAKYDYAEQCDNFRFISVTQNGKRGLLNYNGDIVIPCLYDFGLSPDEYGVVRVRLDGKWGMLDTLNNVLVPPLFDGLSSVYHGLIIAEVNNLYGLLNVRGDTIIPFEYSYINNRSLGAGRFLVEKGDKRGYIDSFNNVVIPFMYTYAHPFVNGYAAVGIDGIGGKFGVINDKNEVIVPFEYDFLEPVTNGNFRATKNKLNGVINLNNEIIIPIEYSSIYPFVNGYAIVRKNKLYGVIDTNNRVVIPIKYPEFHEFNNDRIYIHHRYQYYGYVDTLGNESFQPDFNIFRPEWGSIDTPPAIVSKNTVALHSPNNAEWGLPLVLKLVLSALRGEPRTYGDYDEEQLTKVCIAYGLCIGVGNYAGKLTRNHKSWQAFKQKTIYKILGSEKLRQVAWDWAKPYVKISFQTMHPYHRQIYKNCGAYLNNYMATYNVKQVRHYMKYQERRFAHYNLAGQPDPYRKLGAFVDRLIVLHKVMSVKDAQQWVASINTEVQSW